MIDDDDAKKAVQACLDRYKEVKGVKRYSIDDFCYQLRVRKKELANYLNVHRQQITTWCKPDSVHFIEHDRNAKKIRIIRAEREVKTAEFTG